MMMGHALGHGSNSISKPWIQTRVKPSSDFKAIMESLEKEDGIKLTNKFVNFNKQDADRVYGTTGCTMPMFRREVYCTMLETESDCKDGAYSSVRAYGHIELQSIDCF